MCLLISQPAGTVWTPELITDFYTRNADGVGVMWAQDGYLHYEKTLPKNAQEAVEFVQTHANGKACALHFRMRTHGHTDHDNCHPYEVFGFETPHEMPLLMMHNGVLHTGNAADTSKSDTHHYVRNYLRPLLDKNPELAFSPEFSDLIGKHIGNNRFVLMNHEGQQAVINRSQGVEYNGAWLSNTYAWSAAKYMPRKQSTFDDWGGWGKSTYTAPKSTKGTRGAKNKKSAPLVTHQLLVLDPFLKADVDEVRDTLDTFYMGNAITDKQIEQFLRNTDARTVYFSLELLMDGKVTERAIDTLFANPREQRMMATMKYSDYYTSSETTREYAL